MTYFLIAVGAVTGAISRYEVDRWAMSWNPHLGFPWGTFIINISGSLLIGVLANALPLDARSRLLLMVGFCGSFTTFSTFSLEIVKLIMTGQHAIALGYVALSVVGGPVVCYAGYYFSQR